MKKILITGVPGMGKTTLGDEFKNRRGFEHIEMETNPDAHQLLISNRERFIEILDSSKKDVVITWGFYPPNSTEHVLFLKSNGLKLIWLDGDRDSAFREYKKRVAVQDPNNLALHIEAFNKQIERINTTNVIQEIAPIAINTFNENGQFRDIGEIMAEIEKL